METNDNEIQIDLQTISTDKRDHLERYFDDIYKRELVYKIKTREVGFIQDGIEHLVRGINRFVAFNSRANLKSALDVFQNQHTNVTLTPNTSEDLDTCFETDILKIGSFYEHTKNAFPDEFDFVFILGNFKSSEITRSRLPYVNQPEVMLHDTMKTTLCSEIGCRSKPQNMKAFETPDLVYRLSEEDRREIRFERFLERRDYSSRLQFVYTSNDDTEHPIHVDITTGFRIVENIDDKVDNRCPLPGFANEQIDNNSVLVVGGMVHFTEKEVHFMKNVLSEKHTKVYRIMKYLINGHGDYDKVRKMLKVSAWNTLISNYTIKLQIIYHHYECKFQADDTLSTCILDVLEQLTSTSSSMFVRNLSDVPNRHRIFRDEHRKRLLRDLHISMIKIRKSKRPYVYENHRLTPIATSYLQQENDTPSTRSCWDVIRRFLPVIIVTLLVFGIITVILAYVL